jgi:hypothetical protein
MLTDEFTYAFRRRTTLKSRRRFFLLPSIVLAVHARLFAEIGKFGGSGVDSGGLYHSGPGVPFILVPFDQMQNLASLLGMKMVQGLQS